jgi:hypothetical protein
MKFLIAALMGLFTFTSYAQVCQKGNFLEVYDGMNPDDQEIILKRIEPKGITLSDFNAVEYEVTCLENSLSAKIKLNEELAPKSVEMKRFLFKLGVGFIAPVYSPEINAKLGVVNKKTGKFIATVNVSAATSFDFKNFTYENGSTQFLGIGASAYIPKTNIYLGPLFKLIWINNPRFYNQQNFFLPSFGAQAGWDIPIKLGSKRHMDIDAGGFIVFGGLKNADPRPFLHWGGTVRFTLPYKKAK